MPKDGMVIAALVLLCVGAAAADQLLHRAIPSAGRGAARPAALALSGLPVSHLGPAIAHGAEIRLNRMALAD